MECDLHIVSWFRHRSSHYRYRSKLRVDWNCSKQREKCALCWTDRYWKDANSYQETQSAYAQKVHMRFHFFFGSNNFKSNSGTYLKSNSSYSWHMRAKLDYTELSPLMFKSLQNTGNTGSRGSNKGVVLSSILHRLV